jgi:cation diffusion facilitator CzcD-associated flavoprotein CzcO
MSGVADPRVAIVGGGISGLAAAPAVRNSPRRRLTG